MNRSEIERLLNALYAARVRGDAAAIVEKFANDAVFRIAGSPQASPVAAETLGARSLRNLLDQLIRAFEFKDHKILTLLIDGSRAAVLSRVTVRSVASGATATTEIFDLVEVADGRISSLT
jgi:ketosteroid isomerase-like protein